MPNIKWRKHVVWKSFQLCLNIYRNAARFLNIYIYESSFVLSRVVAWLIKNFESMKTIDPDKIPVVLLKDTAELSPILLPYEEIFPNPMESV